FYLEGFGNMQKCLDDAHPTGGELFLIGTNRIKAAANFFLIHPAVHAWGDNVFILRSGRVHTLPRARTVGAHGPYEVMLEFFFSGFSKPRRGRTLRVKDGEDGFYRPALAGGIHALQDDQDGWSIRTECTPIGKEQFLKLA